MRSHACIAVMVMSGLLCLPARSDSGGGWESWVYSLTPEQLCAAYLDDIVTDEDLPGGRGQDPCPEDALYKDYPW